MIVPNLPPEKIGNVASFVKKSHENHIKSKELFFKCMNALDLALDENEIKSMKFLERP